MLRPRDSGKRFERSPESPYQPRLIPKAPLTGDFRISCFLSVFTL